MNEIAKSENSEIVVDILKIDAYYNCRIFKQVCIVLNLTILSS